MTEPLTEPPGAAFAATMSAAADSVTDLREEAPYGYTRDRDTGEVRAKKTAGRPKRSPSVDELKDSSAGDVPPPPPPAEDRAPSRPKTNPFGRAKRDPGPVPDYRAGVITKGVNKLYRRGGKIVRAMDADIGEAIIMSARNTADEGEEDDSVGAAWDELARTNPRVRRFLMKAIAGGAWGSLIMAHAPIAMAIFMKPRIRELIPFQGLVESLAEPDDEGGTDLPSDMTAPDVGQMQDLAHNQMADIAKRMGVTITPEMEAEAIRMAQGMANGQKPTTQVRQQPHKARARAARHGG
jgi:hypothetical protein